MTVGVAPADIASFWGEAGPDKWFEQDENLDQAIRMGFLPTYEAAANGELALGRKRRGRARACTSA